MHTGFIFSPGIWLGEGTITFATSPDIIKFYTKWEISENNQSCIHAKQVVEMQGIKEKVVNHFIFTDFTDTSFSVCLESEAMGRVQGLGAITPVLLRWEIIQSDVSSQGFETYELQDNGTYCLHAEYKSTDPYQTTVDGLIWKKGVYT